ncbi:MAG: ABC transporter permease [Verrucomicrobia bacterium]|nr:MAG: ABC transporter permease [Verrucomicrobiota bacterium]
MNAAEASWLARLGARTTQKALDLLQVLAVLSAAVVLALRPGTWRRTVRAVFARQFLFTAVEAVGLAGLLGALAGLLVVVQANLWLNRAGLTTLAGPLLVAVVVRELGPLLANLLIVVNSGSAMAAEMGLMRLRGEVRVLEAQGIEPLPYLVMPRVAAAAVAALCLTLVLIVVAFASGFVFGSALEHIRSDAFIFTEQVLRALRPADVLTVLFKSVTPAVFTAVICTTTGLNAGAAASDIPLACRRALARSLGALFLINALISALLYV